MSSLVLLIPAKSGSLRLRNKNPQFKLKTFDLNKSIGYKISQLESIDINTNDDLNLAKALNIKEKIF